MRTSANPTAAPRIKDPSRIKLYWHLALERATTSVQRELKHIKKMNRLWPKSRLRTPPLANPFRRHKERTPDEYILTLSTNKVYDEIAGFMTRLPSPIPEVSDNSKFRSHTRTDLPDLFAPESRLNDVTSPSMQSQCDLSRAKLALAFHESRWYGQHGETSSSTKLGAGLEAWRSGSRFTTPQKSAVSGFCS